MTHAVYAGTFDPFTKGHENVLKQAMPFFDEITLAVGINPEKSKAMFTLDERISFLRAVADSYDSINVGSFEITGPSACYLVDYAEGIEAQYIIRGLRNAADFEYERAMMEVNKGINPRIKTMFFMADPEFGVVSSSLVRGLIGPKNWPLIARDYIPTSMWKPFIAFSALKGR